MVDASSYLQAFITVGGAIMGIWGFVKVMRDIKKNSDEEHDRRKRWDNAAQVIEDKAAKWDKGLEDVYDERGKIVDRFDERLDEVDRKIDENHADTEAKIQTLQAMLIMTIKSVNALLDEMVNKGANGNVKKMHTELNDYITEQIGK